MKSLNQLLGRKYESAHFFRLNDQVTELMNSFQNPGFYRYQPFERLQPDEVSGADNSSSHSDTFQDEAQLPPREPSPQPSTSTQSVTNKMVDSKRVRRTTKVRNKTQGTRLLYASAAKIP